jgi:hypothetical protein
LSEESPWLQLEEAAKRCARAGVSSEALPDILKSGRVPVRAKCSGHVRADPIEQLLSQVNAVEVYPFLNEIVLRVDPLSPDERQIAIQHDPFLRELAAKFQDVDPILVLRQQYITFVDVVVHWPKLVEELQAAGFKKIGLTSELASSRRRRLAEPLRPAPAAEIHKMISAVYDGAEAAGEKPPNLVQIIQPVQDLLRKKRYRASGKLIQELAQDAQHAARRRKPRLTVASEKRK